MQLQKLLLGSLFFVHFVTLKINVCHAKMLSKQDEAVNMRLKPTTESTKEYLKVLRITLFLCLLLTSALGGYFSFTTLNGYEEQIEKLAFDSVASQIEEVSMESFSAKIHFFHSFRAFLKGHCPTVESWPNCTVDVGDYEAFSVGFVVAADIDVTNHEALVTSRYELNTLLAHTANFYNSTGYPDLADVVNGGPFGINETTFERYKIEEPSNSLNHNFLLPIIQILYPRKNIGALMLEIYSRYHPIVDDSYSCIRSFDGTHGNSTIHDIGEQCMVVSRTLRLVQNSEVRPAVVVHYPMMLAVDNISAVSSDVLANRPTIEMNDVTYVLVGQLSAVFLWERFLTKAVSQKTDGLDILLTDGTSDYYYTFENGVAVYHADRTFSRSRRSMISFPLTSLSNSAYNYSLTIQGNDVFGDEYHTKGPIFSSILFVCAVLFCIFNYGLYDIQTTKIWDQNDQAKRNFVRYISHEIRTPLTTVSIGIKLVMKELRSLSFMSGSKSSNDKFFNSISEYDADDTVDDFEISRSRSAARSKQYEKEMVVDLFSVLESAESSVEVATLILTDLLNYDKIQNGTLQISCSYLSAVDLVSVATKRLKGVFQGAHMKLVVNNLVSEMDINDSGDISYPKKASACSSNVDDKTHADNVDYMAVVSPESPPPLVLYGDMVKLHEVFRNLITNAIKFTPENGLVTITSSWNKDAIHSGRSRSASEKFSPCGSLVVTIKDNGPGISPENLKAVFYDGWQFKANMLQGGEGSGLGMWITKNIVEAHHGTLTCSSEGLGKGSTMRLELPVFMGSIDAVTGSRGNTEIKTFCDDPISNEQENNSDRTTIKVTKVVPTEEHSGAGKRVLVVDDSTMCRKMVCRLLRSMSYECIEAKNGEDCVERVMECNRSEISGETESGPISGRKVDFVLLDYEMPIMNGPTAAKTLRARGFTVPIIGLTGNVVKVDIDYFMTCGANAVLTKPFSQNGFISVVGNY